MGKTVNQGKDLKYCLWWNQLKCFKTKQYSVQEEPMATQTFDDMYNILYEWKTEDLIEHSLFCYNIIG